MASKKIAGTTRGARRSADPELDAMRQVHAALSQLQDPDAQIRVLEYVTKRLALHSAAYREPPFTREPESVHSPEPKHEPDTQRRPTPKHTGSAEGAELEGVSPVAQKWVKRNGLVESQLNQLFTLGLDNIDLVAKIVPGRTVTDKLRNVALLEGTAAYLSTGIARIPHDKLRETAGHYKALDTNFAKNMKRLASDVVGTQAGGFTLTTRGLSAAGDLIKEMTTPKK